MDVWTQESEAAFSAYVDHLARVIGHADRVDPLRDYCLGLLMPLERKSVEPGGRDIAGAGGRQASIPSAFRRAGAVVGQGLDGPGP